MRAAPAYHKQPLWNTFMNSCFFFYIFQISDYHDNLFGSPGGGGGGGVGVTNGYGETAGRSRRMFREMAQTIVLTVA